ncbi:MAG: tetratricopeptide repeat protein, partial [Anaerovoracaceae bacterium]
ERAISIFEKETGGKDVHYATAMAAMGGLAYQEGKLSQAKEYYEQAKALTERDFGKNLNYERICDAINQIHQAMARS